MCDAACCDVHVQLLARHSELQQSETKAQAALVTILSLTQITELKLLLDIGRQGHRFYEFVLTMLIACISLELLIGIIIIYVGNLHYHQQHDRNTSPRACNLFRILACLFCQCRCCGRSGQCCRQRVAYSSVMETSTSSGQLAAAGARAKRAMPPPNGDELLAPKALPEMGMIEDDEEDVGCCGFPTPTAAHRNAASIADLERADVEIETARIRGAEAELRIVRTGNYVRTLEDALRRATDSGCQTAGLNEELAALRAEHEAAIGVKKEADAERRAAEARQYHAFYARELAAARRERITFRKLSRWQHAATYLLYFVMLMNIFVTTFGISGSAQDLFVARPINASTSG